MSLKLLGLPDSTSEASLKAHWRKLAATHHPDRGGSSETFSDLRKQYEAALLEVAKPYPCKICGGGKKIVKTQGFYQTSVSCTSCQGLGTWPRV